MARGRGGRKGRSGEVNEIVLSSTFSESDRADIQSCSGEVVPFLVGTSASQEHMDGRVQMLRDSDAEPFTVNACSKIYIYSRFSVLFVLYSSRLVLHS